MLSPPIVQPTKSSRPKRSAIPSDYLCHLQEVEFNIGDHDDPTTYKTAMESSKSSSWQATMEDELDSMYKNNVWTLVMPLDNVKSIGL